MRIRLRRCQIRHGFGAGRLPEPTDDPVLATLLLERPADEPPSISFRRVLEAMGGMFEQDRDIILARGRLWFEVPALRARLWEEVEKAQVFMNGLPDLVEAGPARRDSLAFTGKVRGALRRPSHKLRN